MKLLLFIIGIIIGTAGCYVGYIGVKKNGGSYKMAIINFICIGLMWIFVSIS